MEHEHEHGKKQIGQYPAILTEQAWSITHIILYVLFTGWEVRIGKNCARGLEYGPRPQAKGCTQDRGHSFSLYGLT